MTFKDILHSDFETFLNLDEFAEVVELNGKNIPAVLIKSTGKSSTGYTVKKQLDSTRHANILHGNFFTVYFKSCGNFKAGSNVILNGKKYRISESVDAQGITKLILAADEQSKIPNVNF